MYDVVILGGGPAGLQAALTLGRGQRRVLLADAGPRRNALAVGIHNFVTRDGTPPDVFRDLGRRELEPYAVVLRSSRATAIDGVRGDFSVRFDDGDVRTKRVILATGMIDDLPDVPGYRELWGHAVFQCPYCHGHEVRGQRWATWSADARVADFGLILKGWTADVIVFSDAIDGAGRERLAAAGVAVETRPVVGLEADGQRLVSMVLADGTRIPRDILFAHPQQRQVPLVAGLGLRLDEMGYVAVDRHQTSIPGIYAAGDLTTPLQAAVIAAAAGMSAAAMVNHDLSASPGTSAVATAGGPLSAPAVPGSSASGPSDER